MARETDFTDFVTARWSSLYRLAYLLTGSRADAEDLLQEALERAYVKWSRIVDLDEPEPYVRRMLVNTMLSRQRRAFRRHEVAVPVLPEPGRPAAEADPVERAVLWPIVCALPPRQRAVVVLRYYEDLSEEQIAAVLGCSRGSVKSQAHDAMAALRRAVGAVGAAEVVVDR